MITREKEYIGKLFKKYICVLLRSKKKLIWRIKINGRYYEIVCKISKISGKRAVYIDDQLVL
jgi:hypothetical protein